MKTKYFNIIHLVKIFDIDVFNHDFFKKYNFNIRIYGLNIIKIVVKSSLQ